MASPDRSVSTWLSLVRERIKDEHYSENETEVSIFIVPKSLMIIAPTCYTPQHVALGPNHYWRPEIHDMEGYKIAAAQRVQHRLRSRKLNFEGLVKQFAEKHEANIRASYQRFTYLDKEDLVWVMAIDTAFLLEFLQLIYFRQVRKERKKADESTSHKATGSLVGTSVKIDFTDSTSNEVPTEANLPDYEHVHVHDLYRRSTSALNTILRDMVMLENQIPLFLLIEMLKYQWSSEESANDMLYAMLKAFCKKFCPFKFIKYLEKAAVSQRAHLLDFMYRTILPKDVQTLAHGCEIEEQNAKTPSVPFQKSNAITNLLSKMKELPFQFSFLKKFSTRFTSRVNIVTGLVSKLKGEGSSVGSDGDSKKPPEIAIPSATELARAGVRFSPSEDGREFASISFDAKKAIFYLPNIKLDENTEVILRNLVAYEASRHRSLYFTRYTELMNGVIDSAEDVRLLKERNIIQNHLKSDEEAANMWNGISRSIKKKKVGNLDDVIKNVNKYYNSRWMIKFHRYMRLHVYESWQFLTFMAAVLLLLLQIFEAFCSVYNCNKQFHFM